MDITTILFIIITVIAALAIAVFQYFYKLKSTSNITVLLTFIRFLGIFSMLLLLINPKIENEELEIVKPKLYVAIDNSSSVKFLKNDANVVSLLDEIRSNSALNDKFKIDYFSFDSKLDVLDSLNFKVNRTNIREALVSLDALHKDKTAVMLVTDGNQTLGADYTYHKSKGTIFPIIVGDTVKHIDLEVSKLNANSYSFLGNNFPVEIFLNYNGTTSVNSILTVKTGNTTVFRENISLNGEKNSEQVIFNVEASKVGVMNYTATLTPLNEEKNKINNRKNFSVEVIDEQSQIAIIADIKHPDLGMYKRAIESNKQRKVVYLNSSVATSELASYQLVILYQPTNSFKNVFEALEQKEMNTFIITGTQTDWTFLNNIQGYFSKSVISQTENYTADFNNDYSAFVVENFDIEELPPLHAFFGEVSFKAPYEALLFQNVGGFKTENPLLATYMADTKRGAVLFGENSWKWRALSFTKNKSFDDFDGFINKLIQYLAVKKAFNRVELSYDNIVYQNDIMKISANYFDNNFTKDIRASLSLTLKNLQSNETKVYPFLLNKNTFELNLSNLISGDYSFIVKVDGQNITRAGRFTVLDYNIEQQFTYANVDALNEISVTSGGKTFHLNKTDEVIEELLEDPSYKSIQKSTKKIVPVIDWKWLLALIILFFSSEWFIRKYRGMI